MTRVASRGLARWFSGVQALCTAIPNMGIHCLYFHQETYNVTLLTVFCCFKRCDGTEINCDTDCIVECSEVGSCDSVEVYVKNGANFSMWFIITFSCIFWTVCSCFMIAIRDGVPCTRRVLRRQNLCERQWFTPFFCWYVVFPMFQRVVFGLNVDDWSLWNRAGL